MKTDQGFQKLGDLMGNKPANVKPPAHQWQDLALRIIKELGVPAFKRNSVFKVCKEHPQSHILSCLGDTKELCQSGQKWKYFFKLIGQDNKNNGS